MACCSSSPATLLALALLATCLAVPALAGERVLGTLSGSCKDQFGAVMKEHYKGDATCADAIRKAMSVAPKSESDCPGGASANAGSEVQRCMSKSKASVDAWTSFIKTCEILNVNERTGAGEAEAAATAKPSCFPRFNSLGAFQSYLKGEAAKSGAASSSLQGGVLAAAAAAAGAWLLL